MAEKKPSPGRLPDRGEVVRVLAESAHKALDHLDDIRAYGRRSSRRTMPSGVSLWAASLFRPYGIGVMPVRSDSTFGEEGTEDPGEPRRHLVERHVAVQSQVVDKGQSDDKVRRTAIVELKFPALDYNSQMTEGSTTAASWGRTGRGPSGRGRCLLLRRGVSSGKFLPPNSSASP